MLEKGMSSQFGTRKEVTFLELQKGGVRFFSNSLNLYIKKCNSKLLKIGPLKKLLKIYFHNINSVTEPFKELPERIPGRVP